MRQPVIYELTCGHPPCCHEFITLELMAACPKCGIAVLCVVTDAGSGCWSTKTLKWFQQQTVLPLHCAAQQRCEAFSSCCTARLGLIARKAGPD